MVDSQIVDDVMDWQCFGLTKWREKCKMTDQVESEMMEHAYLDFLDLDLGLDFSNMNYGQRFVKDEEKEAHMELDIWLEDHEVSRRQEDGGQEERMKLELRIPDGDLCNSGAYFGEGTWWIDRWVLKMDKGVATDSAKTEGSGKKLAMGICAWSKKSFADGESTPVCSGTKRKRSGRDRRWGLSMGSCPSTSRSPWRSTATARSRLARLRESVEARMCTTNDNSNINLCPRGTTPSTSPWSRTSPQRWWPRVCHIDKMCPNSYSKFLIW